MRYRFLAAIWILGAVFSTNTAHASDERPIIVAYGDSLTAGYGLSSGLGYAPQLQDALRREGIAATVIDAGVSGDTTSAGRERLGWTLDGLQEKPDLLILELGGNDMLRALDPAIARDNLIAMMEELKRRDIPVLIMGMRAAPNYDPAYVRTFEAIYPMLAARFDAALYPYILDGVTAVPGMTQADAIHPTFAGIKVMVRGSLPAVRQALGR